jgi:hypothetical protein
MDLLGAVHFGYQQVRQMKSCRSGQDTRGPCIGLSGRIFFGCLSVYWMLLLTRQRTGSGSPKPVSFSL